MVQKVAVITGITGQDGSYLAELLLSKNYKIHGIIRRTSNYSLQKLAEILKKYPDDLVLHYGDLSDLSSLISILIKTQPDEIYNLGCQSHVKVSFEVPIYTSDIAAIGFLNLLEAVKATNLNCKTKIYQASSSEMYGDNKDDFKSETSIMIPCSPYGAGKLFSHNLANIYRSAYNMFICSGILFNHESPRRNESFVTRKISLAVARIKLQKQQLLELGNLEAVRDWGHAKDYVEAMWKMLQQEQPNDYVIATGTSYTVRDFAEICFSIIGIKLTWENRNTINEVGKDQEGVIRLKINPKYFREKEVNHLKGNSDKAKKELNWSPKVTLFVT